VSVTPDEYKNGMRQLPAGVCVITTGRAPNRGGLTATAVMSLTAEPPQLVAAVNRSGAALSLITQNRAFAVNVLSAIDIALAEIFAGRTRLVGEDRFVNAEWTELATQSPILTRAIVSFDCLLADAIPVATHTLLVGSVQQVRLGKPATPLLHCNGEWANITTAIRHDGFVDELELMRVAASRQP
jgi:flavin reductase